MGDAQLIVTHFCIPEHVMCVAALGEGFINKTFLVKTSARQQYILQCKNRSVFPNIPAMMENISKVTHHILSEGGNTFRLVAAKDGKWYHKDTDGEYWACFTYIPDTYTFEHAVDIDLVRAGGQGVGLFNSQMAGFTGFLEDTLPGFHNISYRFEQFAGSLKRAQSRSSDANESNGISHLEEVSSLVEEVYSRKEQMEAFWELVRSGTLPRRVSHNDTKLSNFLFDKDRQVVCAIDLDTVMQTTVLFDFGDAIRSYANPFPEDHPLLQEVKMDLERFSAFSQGYLCKAAWFLNKEEKTHLAFSALYITYEQYLRFLMDYMDGDTYYRTRYPGHNLVRARSQLALLKSMEAQLPAMQHVLSEIFNTL
ncbi:MAG TPA: aminoglycoside phosphotransferase family protein [Bacteroidales bacterium]|jgi:serine/threonine protein kinase|nr:aminoglycoside phosphotransferase family protein [Bacteroidales bacterium]MCZ2416054.1 aminoglycoside phosphotransferase family protein [Burkholderiales bacterium]NLZ08708.1 aminoglycoside phosphotransferase family protein [Bacteroidales bacterium]HOF76037.1 aminoglycoside phosphotransferase family protein [Bacteroidales bacterium]HOQ96921.1 aminoglycoside phosphotransferase family protein [Bacteroidales bacterium]